MEKNESLFRRHVCPDRLKYSALGTVIFYLAANAFILFNYIPQHDDLNYVSDFGETWALILGKFMVPVYGRFRGIITAPFLIGIISMICITAVVYMLVDLLEINRPLYIFLTAGFLSANITQTENLSLFLFLADVYMAAAMLSCLAVYISRKKNGVKWKTAAVLCMAFSMGLYQAYLSFALTLILILLLKNILKKGRVCKEDVFEMLKTAGLMLAGAAVYFVINKIVLALTGLQERSDYHSISSLLQDLGSISNRFYVAYGSKISMFFIRKGMGTGRVCNCLSVVVFAVIVHLYFRKLQASAKTRFLFFLLLAGSTAVALMFNIGAGMVAYRLSFSICLYYVFALFLLDNFPEISDSIRNKNLLTGIGTCLLCLTLWANIVYSNGAYTTQKVIFDRSISLYTRVLDDIYEIPEYRHNQTPVVLLGDWTFDAYASNLSKKEYRDLGAFLNTSVTYPQTVKNLLRYLGEDVNLAESESIRTKITESPEAQAMPSFPYKGYIRMIDGCLVIKF